MILIKGIEYVIFCVGVVTNEICLGAAFHFCCVDQITLSKRLG